MIMAFVAKNMGGVIQVATGVYGGASGPILAMFVMALCVPFTNPKVSSAASAAAGNGYFAGVVKPDPAGNYNYRQMETCFQWMSYR